MSIRDAIRANDICKIRRIIDKPDYEPDKLQKVFMLTAEEGK